MSIENPDFAAQPVDLEEIPTLEEEVANTHIPTVPIDKLLRPASNVLELTQEEQAVVTPPSK